MSVKELEQRVLALERQVKQLESERSPAPAGGLRGWQATVEKFKNDEHLLAVFAEAMKIRHRERRAVRRGRTKSRRPKS